VAVSSQAGPLERSQELAAIGSALESATASDGALVLIEGPPGIGKTRLLREGALRASESFDVLWARADALEQEVPFGLVRQLFEKRVAGERGRRRAAILAGAARLAEPVLEPRPQSQPGDGATLWHGLYWLAANLSAQAPLALVIDDLHWADIASLEWLGYLARRLEGLPVVVLAAARRTEGDRTRLMEALRASGGGGVLAPRPLSRTAVGRLVEELTGAEPDSAFTAACLEASGGNPFLLRELVRAAASEGIATSAPDASRVAALAPETVTRALLVRLAGLPPAATELAQAVAVLGHDVPPDAAAELAGLSPGAAAAAADALAAAHIFGTDRELGFIHPLVRTAIEEEMPPSRRRAAHARAASILAEGGGDPERRAVHLLFADPAGSAEVVETLRATARRARERGAARSAVTYLARALEEPPEPAVRPALLEELGVVAASAGDPRAVDWLREAYAAADAAAGRARLALALGRALMVEGRLDDAFAAIDEAEADLGADERWMAARLESELIVAARLDHRLRARVPDRLDRLERLSEGDRDARLLLLAHRAYEAALAGEPADGPAEMAHEALAGGQLLAALGPEDPSIYLALNALSLCERLEEARQAFDAAIAVARERGSALGFAIASCFRSQVHYRRGEVRGAEADARAAIEVAAAEGWGVGIPAARAFLVYALVERGDLDEARQVLDEAELGDEIPDLVMFDPLLDGRGRLRIASGQVAEGVADLLACGERQERWGGRNPSVIPWRSTAAEAMLRVSRGDEARELADEEVELARRAGTPRALGMALRVAGLVRQDQRLLEEAVATLERGPSPLETARARISLAATLRGAGRPDIARDQLRHALDEADRAGASALAREARDELVAAGARPRRARLSGRDALTASELRVASRAAEGRTNREIAQALFVTVKTVETHLGNAYRKLGIASRAELQRALDADG
jgi:ATP/maltotriose-dependent transcriptional regulator MalT